VNSRVDPSSNHRDDQAYAFAGADRANNPLQVAVETATSRTHTLCICNNRPRSVPANTDMRLLRDKTKKRLYITLAVVGIGAMRCGAANAVDVGVGINVGTPAPVIVAPQPVVIASPGWQGDRYWDGRRYWDRDEWEEHHHDHHHDHDHGHCPPGHAKKGEC
jgi:hypothetical protein